MQIFRNGIGTAAITFVCCISGLAQLQQRAAEMPSRNALHAVHNALFASFLPIDELPDDPSTTALLTTARDGIWQQASATPAMQQLLAPFADLSRLGSACGVATAIKDTGTTSFASLSPGKRQQVLLLLQSCTEQAPRRLAATARNLYIVKGYGAAQGELTGTKLNLFAPRGYVEANMPQLAPTRLAYDNVKRELVEKDGHAIDVLVVGSGPAGSVLAHELRRGGKRVVLLERGSFVIPGSMETRLIDDLIDTRTTTDGGIRVRNGMAVGGGSEVNVDLCLPPLPKPFASRSKAGAGPA
jgi:hypothetical protein